MPSTIEFPFSDDAALLTILITLKVMQASSISANALLDTGSTVNFGLGLEPVHLTFAWARAFQVPLTLGQTNY